MSPRRIQRQRTKGWRMPEGARYVGRPTRWGNLYRVGAGEVTWAGPAVGASVGHFDHLDHCDIRWCDQEPVRIAGGLTPDEAVFLYRADLTATLAEAATDPYCAEIASALTELRGRDLACWCALDSPCHADVLLDLANRPEVALASPKERIRRSPTGRGQRDSRAPRRS